MKLDQNTFNQLRFIPEHHFCCILILTSFPIVDSLRQNSIKQAKKPKSIYQHFYHLSLTCPIIRSHYWSLIKRDCADCFPLIILLDFILLSIKKNKRYYHHRISVMQTFIFDYHTDVKGNFTIKTWVLF